MNLDNPKMDITIKEKYFEDSSEGNDYLDMNIYADALSEIIKNKNNINIGIYAEWGQGKSFLMNLLKKKLKLSKKEREEIYIRESSCMFCGCNNNITKCILNCLNNNFEVESNNNDIEKGLKTCKSTCFYCGEEDKDDNCFIKCFKGIFGGLCKASEEYVIVDFNAWIYEGSDNLWAGLIERLHSTMENYFGWLRIRWFRIFDYEYPTMKEKLGLLFSYLFYVGIPCLLGIIFWYIFEFYNDDYAGSMSILIGTGASGAYLLTKFLKTMWELSKSQAQEIIKNSNKTKEKLGFMNEVKKEIKIISKFLKYNNKRVVIFIDDLDRCHYKKAVDVLNSVMLLLSEKDSRFITFFAIDPRIVIKSIESTYSQSLLKAGINGFEYLDKIIQIPFVLSKKTLNKNNKKNLIKNLLESDYNTKILENLDNFINNYFLSEDILCILDNKIITDILNNNDNISEMEKYYSEKMSNKKENKKENKEKYISLKNKYLTYDNQYNMNFIKYLNMNKKFFESLKNLRQNNLFLDNKFINNNFISILKFSGCMSEKEIDLMILNLFYIKNRIKNINSHNQNLDEIIKVFKDFYDKIINKIFLIRINKENIKKKLINKLLGLKINNFNSLLQNNFSKILELIIKEDENFSYFDNEYKNKVMILELINFINEISKKKNYLKKFLPYKMIMITISNNEFDENFVNNFINENIRNKEIEKDCKIQIKRENITFNLFPKIKEYDTILSNYFKNDKKIDLFKRINYLDNKYSNINIYDYYDNSIYKKDNKYLKKESDKEIPLTNNDISITEYLYSYNFNLENNEDNFTKSLLNHNNSFLINYMFKKYIPTYYDYMKNTKSHNGLEIDQYKLKNWYILRNDYEGNCLKYIINMDNQFHSYLKNNYSEEINTKDYEFPLKRSVVFLPTYEENNTLFFHRDFHKLQNKKEKILSIENEEDISIGTDEVYFEKLIKNFEKKKQEGINNSDIKSLQTYLMDKYEKKYSEGNYYNNEIKKILGYENGNKFYIIDSGKELFSNLNNFFENLHIKCYKNLYDNQNLIFPCKEYKNESDISNHKDKCKYCILLSDQEFIRQIDFMNNKKNTVEKCYQSTDIDKIFLCNKIDCGCDIEILSNIEYINLYHNLEEGNYFNKFDDELINTFLLLKNKKLKIKKLLFEEYVNIQNMKEESSLVKDENGNSIGEVSLDICKKRKEIHKNIKNVNKELSELLPILLDTIKKRRENTFNGLEKIYNEFNVINLNELRDLNLNWDQINMKINDYEENILSNVKLIIENEILSFNDKNKNNIFHYLIFYGRIDLFFKLNFIINLSENINGRDCLSILATDFINKNNVNNIDFNEETINMLEENSFLKDINICSLGINIFNYNTLIKNLVFDFEKNKDNSLNFIDKDIYQKKILKDLIKNEGWGYELNYFNEDIWYSSNYYKKSINNEYIINSNEDYPVEILYNSINLYYDYFSNKNDKILKNIKYKNNSIYQKTVYEICLQEKLNFSCYNVKFNNDNVENIRNILKELNRIYINYNDQKKKGIKMEKDTIKIFESYLLEYRRDNNGNIIGGSNYDYLRDCNFNLLTEITYSDDKKSANHPFSNHYNIHYFLGNIKIIDAMKIIDKILISLPDDVNKYNKTLFQNLYISYHDLNNFYNLNKNLHFKHIFNTKYTDYKNEYKVFDIPKDYTISIDEDNVDIIYELLCEYPIYNFYIEFKYFILNLVKNGFTDFNFLKEEDYKINCNEWSIFKKGNDNYIIHKESNKIYLNIYPNFGLKYFSIKDIYNKRVIDIFTNIIYGYNFNYLKLLYDFQDTMWEKKNFNDDIVYNDLLEINMTQEELDFIYECLDFFKTNPRKIKRILNIISLTRYIIDHKKSLEKDIDIFEKKLIYKLIIKFTILYEQWPYRTTWLSIWINECNELINYDNFNENKQKSKWFPEKLYDNIKKYKKDFGNQYIDFFLKNTSLKEMYYFVEEYIFSSENLSDLSKMDCDPDLFCQFLELDICNKNSNQCVWSCLDMMKIDNINFNHNPAIYATCIDEINKLQINKKYKLNLSNLILKETYKNGFPVRNINKFKQEMESEILEGNNNNYTLMSKNNKEIDNNSLNDNNLTLLIPCEESDENIKNNSINTIINKDIFEHINSNNIKIKINEKK